MRRLLIFTIFASVLLISCENREKKLYADGGQWDLNFIKSDNKMKPGDAKFDFDKDGTYKIFTDGLIIPGSFRTSGDSIWLNPEIKGEPTVAKYYFVNEKLKFDIISQSTPLSWEFHKSKRE